MLSFVEKLGSKSSNIFPTGAFLPLFLLLLFTRKVFSSLGTYAYHFAGALSASCTLVLINQAYFLW